VLQEGAREMESQRWVKTNQAAIQAELQTASSFDELAQKFFTTLAPLLKLGYGALYAYTRSQARLQLLGGYAHRGAARRNFALGEGVVGQCAREREPITISRAAARLHPDPLGLGEAAPRALSLLPVLRRERLLGGARARDVRRLGREGAGAARRRAADPRDERRDSRAQPQDAGAARRNATPGRDLQLQATRLEEQSAKLEGQQEELKATEAWFRGIVEAAPDGMLVTDERA
jgi:PAS domain-containing protein